MSDRIVNNDGFKPFEKRWTELPRICCGAKQAHMSASLLRRSYGKAQRTERWMTKRELVTKN